MSCCPTMVCLRTWLNRTPALAPDRRNCFTKAAVGVDACSELPLISLTRTTRSAEDTTELMSSREAALSRLRWPGLSMMTKAASGFCSMVGIAPMLPAALKAAAKSAATVDFPTPPFWFTSDMRICVFVLKRGAAQEGDAGKLLFLWCGSNSAAEKPAASWDKNRPDDFTCCRGGQVEFLDAQPDGVTDLGGIAAGELADPALKGEILPGGVGFDRGGMPHQRAQVHEMGLAGRPFSEGDLAPFADEFGGVMRSSRAICSFVLIIQQMGLAQRASCLQRHGLTIPESPARAHTRSEERRVGKECRSRWSPYH